MSNDRPNTGDPLEFVRSLWGNMGFSLPGMVAPTFDADEIDKRITDLKAVEGWLRMNLSMLQMTIQSMEMQKITLTTVRAMGSMASHASQNPADAAPETPPGEAGGIFSQAALWPWNMMQQMREHLQTPPPPPEAEKTPPPAAAKPRAPRRKGPKPA